MNKDIVYLKQNILLEPLIDYWYSWSHLISPATYAMNITGRHLRIMESYIMAPDLHAEAVKNPQMAGGPFMDYNDNKSNDIVALKSNTENISSARIQFSKDIKTLSGMLSAKSDGTSMKDIYDAMPASLRGFVELVYDIRHQPSFRFFESLLYKSLYYDESLQNICLSIIENDNRPFSLSTPRLPTKDSINLAIPFKHKAIDVLMQMKRVPRSYAEIKNLLNVEDKDDALFRSFFSEERTESNVTYNDPGVRIRYFGHACILVETKEVSILSDPVISYGYDTTISRYTYKDLPEVIDYVIITHNHQDHILLETMLQIRHKVKNIIIPKGGNGALQDPSMKLMFQAIGFHNIIELDELETVEKKSFVITGLPFIGEHCDLDIRSKLCYHIRLAEVTMIFAADSCNLVPELYRKIHPLTGDVDILFLGMECDGAPLSWLYGPLITAKITREMDSSRRLAGSNYSQGLEFLNTFNPKHLFVYAMGQEPWLNYIMAVKYTSESNPIVASNQLLQECSLRGIQGERLFGERTLVF